MEHSNHVRSASGRLHALALIAAAVLFWLSWLLMPGIGVTDADAILTAVGAHSRAVFLSSMLQLASAACLAASIPGLAVCLGEAAAGKWAVGLLAVGACGDAADAIYHQLAYEMTRPGIDTVAMLPVMQRMQSVDLLLLLPMILAFLLGCPLVATVAARLRIVSYWNPALFVCCALAGITGPLLGLTSRTTGLACLGLLSLSLAWIGTALLKPALRERARLSPEGSRWG